MSQEAQQTQKQVTQEGTTGIQIHIYGNGDGDPTCEVRSADNPDTKSFSYRGTFPLAWGQSTLIALNPQVKYQIHCYLRGEQFTSSAGMNMPGGVAGWADIECTVQHGEVLRYEYIPWPWINANAQGRVLQQK